MNQEVTVELEWGVTWYTGHSVSGMEVRMEEENRRAISLIPDRDVGALEWGRGMIEYRDLSVSSQMSEFS